MEVNVVRFRKNLHIHVHISLPFRRYLSCGQFGNLGSRLSTIELWCQKVPNIGEQETKADVPELNFNLQLVKKLT